MHRSTSFPLPVYSIFVMLEHSRNRTVLSLGFTHGASAGHTRTCFAGIKISIPARIAR